MAIFFRGKKGKVPGGSAAHLVKTDQEEGYDRMNIDLLEISFL